jgi:hypothetical protein
VAAIAALTGTDRIHRSNDYAWIDIQPNEFFLDPGRELRRLYQRYRQRGETAAV